MSRYFINLSRRFIGIIFIFSGFVKAVDPIGGSIKFNDYFEAFNLGFFNSFTIPLAFILASLEFLVGTHLLIGIRIKTASWMTLLFMIIFTPITLIIAITNPVSDCGCFGDAIKLSNWQTFYKNIIFLGLSIFIFIKRDKYITQHNNIIKYFISFIYVVFILSVTFYSYYHLPIIDFRPYYVGANINEGMTIPKDAEQPEFETTFIMEKNGKRKTFNANNYPYQDSTWVFIKSKTKLLKKGYKPPIHDFVLTNSENLDITNELLSNNKPTLLVISYRLLDGKWDNDTKEQIKIIKDSLKLKDINTFIVTASNNEDITKFEFSGNYGFEYLTADETMLKTVIRSNPGLVLIQSGNILGKWSNIDIPKVKDFKTPVAYSIKTINKSKEIILSLMLLIGMLFLTFYLFTLNKYK